jgi:hypothetical protein
MVRTIQVQGVPKLDSAKSKSRQPNKQKIASQQNDSKIWNNPYKLQSVELDHQELKSRR